MRLRKQEKKSIVDAIRAQDPAAQIYLFGSRVDDSRKGGDIDILVISEHMTYADKLAVKKKLFSEIDEQKIDLVLSRDADEPFLNMILDQAIKLS